MLRDSQFILGMINKVVLCLIDRSIDIATRLTDELSRNRCSIPVRGKRLSLLCRVQTGSEAHPASYTIATRDCFPGDKVAGA
jgi:hypothetical protein